MTAHKIEAVLHKTWCWYSCRHSGFCCLVTPEGDHRRPKQRSPATEQAKGPAAEPAAADRPQTASGMPRVLAASQERPRTLLTPLGVQWSADQAFMEPTPTSGGPCECRARSWLAENTLRVGRCPPQVVSGAPTKSHLGARKGNPMHRRCTSMTETVSHEISDACSRVVDTAAGVETSKSQCPGSHQTYMSAEKYGRYS